MPQDAIAQSSDYKCSTSRISSAGGPFTTYFILGQMKDSIRISTFWTGDNDKCCLIVHTKGFDEEITDNQSVNQELLSSPLCHNLSFGSSTLKEKVLKLCQIFQVLARLRKGLQNVHPSKFSIHHAYLLLPEGELTLLCIRILFPDTYRIFEERTKSEIKVPRCTLSSELGDLWENSHFTDCCLVVAGLEFQAHKAILAACSPVFRAMF